MKSITHYFSWNNRNTHIKFNVFYYFYTTKFIKKEGHLKKKPSIKVWNTTSQNKLNSIVFMKKQKTYCYIFHFFFILLYRKENSDLGFYCCNNVYLSYLYITRMKEKINCFTLSFNTMYKNINLFPFQSFEKDIQFKSFLFDHLGLILRSTNSMLKTIALKPFLTSVIKSLTWLFATTTKICTNEWSK